MRLYFLPFFVLALHNFNFQISAQETLFKTQAEKEKEEMEKLKILHHRVAFSLHYGNFELFQFAKVTDNTSNIDISDYHKMLNLDVEYYPFEKVAAQFSIGLISIPKTQTVDSIMFTPGSGIRAKGSGKGGALLPVTVGIKKTFLNGLARPYVSLQSGFTFIKIGCGTGTGSINGIEKNVDYQSQYTFCYQLGTGIQLRAGKVVRLDLGLNYYGTPGFSSSIGGINSFQGFYVFGGLNFILNPGK